MKKENQKQKRAKEMGGDMSHLSQLRTFGHDVVVDEDRFCSDRGVYAAAVACV